MDMQWERSGRWRVSVLGAAFGGSRGQGCQAQTGLCTLVACHQCMPSKSGLAWAVHFLLAGTIFISKWMERALP